MSARSVLAWIDGIEARPWLAEVADEIVADSRFAPGKVIIVGVQPLLPLDLNVIAGPQPNGEQA